MQSDSIKELATALAKVQANIKPVRKDKTAKIPTKSGGSYTYHYADLSSVWDACRELLSSNGLAVVQMPEAHGGGDLYLTTTLMHTSGEWMSSMLLLRPADTTPQALGSAITYARRYALAAMVGIVADEDDDGAAASQPTQQRQAPRPQPRTEYVPAEDDRPPANDMQEKRKYFAELRSKAVKARITYSPTKSPAEMSALELDAAINSLEVLLKAPAPRGYTAPAE